MCFTISFWATFISKKPSILKILSDLIRVFTLYSTLIKLQACELCFAHPNHSSNKSDFFVRRWTNHHPLFSSFHAISPLCLSSHFPYRDDDSVSGIASFISRECLPSKIPLIHRAPLIIPGNRCTPICEQCEYIYIVGNFSSTLCPRMGQKNFEKNSKARNIFTCFFSSVREAYYIELQSDCVQSG